LPWTAVTERQCQRASHAGWQRKRAHGARRCARVTPAAASTPSRRSCACREKRIVYKQHQAANLQHCRALRAQDGAAVARVEGADAAALTAAVAEHIGAAAPRGAAPAAAAAATAPAAAPAPPAASGSSAPEADGGVTHGGGTAARIKGLLASAPVILFMKVRSPKAVLEWIARRCRTPVLLCPPPWPPQHCSVRPHDRGKRARVAAGARGAPVPAAARLYAQARLSDGGGTGAGLATVPERPFGSWHVQRGPGHAAETARRMRGRRARRMPAHAPALAHMRERGVPFLLTCASRGRRARARRRRRAAASRAACATRWMRPACASPRSTSWRTRRSGRA